MLNSISNFEFFVAIFLVKDILSYTNQLSKLLQTVQLDLCEAFEEIQATIKVLDDKLAGVDDYSARIVKVASDCASTCGVSAYLPRVGRRRRDDNDQVECVDEHYKRKLVIPFLQHMIDELARRFNKKIHDLFLPSMLICSNIAKVEPEKIDEISANLHRSYSTDLVTDVEGLVAEILRWAQKWKAVEDRPKTLLTSLKACNPDFYPNLFTLMQILCILPVSSAECERSFSALTRLKTYLRSTMEQSRLSSLALIMIHYDFIIDPVVIVELFMNQPNHRFW